MSDGTCWTTTKSVVLLDSVLHVYFCITNQSTVSDFISSSRRWWLLLRIFRISLKSQWCAFDITKSVTCWTNPSDSAQHHTECWTESELNSELNGITFSSAWYTILSWCCNSSRSEVENTLRVPFRTIRCVPLFLKFQARIWLTSGGT